MTGEVLSKSHIAPKDTYVNPEDDIEMPVEDILPDDLTATEITKEDNNYDSSSNIFTL